MHLEFWKLKTWQHHHICISNVSVKPCTSLSVVILCTCFSVPSAGTGAVCAWNWHDILSKVIFIIVYTILFLLCIDHIGLTTRCFIKGTPFSFCHNSLKWWSIYTKFLPVVAEEIQIQNILAKYGRWLNVLCKSWCNTDIIMCREYKLACLNWCCQWLNSCPASMVNLICFTVGKLLKFYHCSHKNCPKWSLSRSCWNSSTFAADCSFQQDSAPADRDCEMVEFLACKRLDFKLPCCLVLTWWTFFISIPD